MWTTAQDRGTGNSASPQWLELEPTRFSQSFNREPFRIRHSLARHPLLQLDRLIQLASALPPADVEINAGDVPESLPGGRRPTLELSPPEVVARIRDCRTWLGLLRVEQDPDYRKLLDELMAQLQPLVDPITPGMRERHGFIFVTSPRSTVPYHMDPEHGFLLHMQGRKQFTVYDGNDSGIVTELEIERHYTQGNRRLDLRPEVASRGRTFDLAPGDGLHVPFGWPHHITNDDQISVSLQISFLTPNAERRARVYKVNRQLRKLGLAPTPFGASLVGDSLKSAVGHAALAARRTVSLLTR